MRINVQERICKEADFVKRVFVFVEDLSDLGKKSNTLAGHHGWSGSFAQTTSRTHKEEVPDI